MDSISVGGQHSFSYNNIAPSLSGRVFGHHQAVERSTRRSIHLNVRLFFSSNILFCAPPLPFFEEATCAAKDEDAMVDRIELDRLFTVFEKDEVWWQHWRTLRSFGFLQTDKVARLVPACLGIGSGMGDNE